VLQCDDILVPKVCYVFDTLLQSKRVPVVYTGQPPSDGVWLRYGPAAGASCRDDRCLAILHDAESWRFLESRERVHAGIQVDGLWAVLPTAGGHDAAAELDIAFDLVANAFYFLSCWEERGEAGQLQSRRLYANSVYRRRDVPQDIVDRYLARLIHGLCALSQRINGEPIGRTAMSDGARYAVVLSHDVDYIPLGAADVAKQAAKSVLRHLVHHRDPCDAALAALGLARAFVRRRDPYGCVPEIIARERNLGVRASFQVAVGHRHPKDVNYRIEEQRIRDYLRAITEAGFDLCLHGSYRSTENPAWYLEEVGVLTERLGRPLGSRQHYLAFDPDSLFAAQEQAGIEYDMSMGYPDQPGPRAGFSYPYFPYCIDEDRPYDVLQISLVLMDVTLRSYLRLKREHAWRVIERVLNDLRDKGGCASVVWHPIVFGGCRDPGFDELFWNLVRHVRGTGGEATDGRTINHLWRACSRSYSSFRRQGRPGMTEAVADVESGGGMS
jgi:hypothetical protein